MSPKLGLSLLAVAALILLACRPSSAQPVDNAKYNQEDKFRQLEEWLPTPNAYRTASGAPGRGYWQQRADYSIDVELDDAKQEIRGKEKITYHNNSPDTLTYLWVQLDGNLFAPDSDAVLTQTAPSISRMSFNQLDRLKARHTFDGGFKIDDVRDNFGKPLAHTIVKTMMRVDLPRPLESGESMVFRIAWHYQVNDSKLVSGRTGAEFFKEDGNYIYEIAQWFPRMACYTDATGWQHKQFLGRGEFTLELGDYVVRLTVPDDHVVAATGTLLNPDEVLTAEQRKRLEQARTAQEPVFVITPEEAKANQEEKGEGKKTWVYQADNVRDFAFATSRKFIWDAQGHDVEGNQVLAMSYYPNEAEPLWSKYSTRAIIHTLNVYSRYTFAYPYPVAISVNGPVYGMEYPMICFNGPRPEKDKTYSKRTKYGLISVIIHEVGHNYFPMIVNSDERQWTWMDEGLNSFLQYLAEQEWEKDYPSRGGEPKDIVGYMKSSNQTPIMTNSDSILQFGPNAYSKPATALNILRESVLGRELFDTAFKEYARRWRFKRPMPADFFRTMEDASGIDLDWFWRGWFYSTNHCDIGIDGIQLYLVDDGNPDARSKRGREKRAAQPQTLSQQRNEEIEKLVDRIPDLKDFYNSYDELDVTEGQKKAYERFLKGLDEQQKKLLQDTTHYYVIRLKNHGGLVMPVILELEFEDGKKQEVRIPAEIWRRNASAVSKLVMTPSTVRRFTLDPHRETADTDLSNNYFPPRIVPSRFELFKKRQGGDNPMKAAKRREAAKKKAEQERKKKEEAKKEEEAKREEAKKEEAKKEEAKKEEAKKEQPAAEETQS